MYTQMSSTVVVSTLVLSRRRSGCVDDPEKHGSEKSVKALYLHVYTIYIYIYCIYM